MPPFISSLVQSVSPEKAAIPKREGQSSPLMVSTTATANVLAHAARPDFHPPLSNLIVRRIYEVSGSRQCAKIASSTGAGGSYSQAVNLPPETKGDDKLLQGFPDIPKVDWMNGPDNGGRYKYKSHVRREEKKTVHHPVVVDMQIELADPKLSTGAQQRPLVLKPLQEAPISCLKLSDNEEVRFVCQLAVFHRLLTY